MNLAFLADENVEMDIVDRLKSLSHITVHASELSPGRPDTAVLEAASQAGQVLSTSDYLYRLDQRKIYRWAKYFQQGTRRLLHQKLFILKTAE